VSGRSKNFSLRLNTDDLARLDRIAGRCALERTSVLRLLIRRAAVALVEDGCFVVVRHGRKGMVFPVRLAHERKRHE
jgi:hypothetical protein